MYQDDCYVVLSPDMTEEFVSLQELQNILKKLLIPMQNQSPRSLPQDLQKITSLELQVERLINTACDLDCQELGIWQWYAVRLEKPKITH
jgi:hypothetical protein